LEAGFSFSVSLWPLNRPLLGAHQRVSACSFPTSASISLGVFSSCFHPVPADDLVVVFAFSAGCSLSFCRNFLSSVVPLFPAVVSDGPILSCLIQALLEGPGPHFLGPVYWWPCTLQVPFGGPIVTHLPQGDSNFWVLDDPHFGRFVSTDILHFVLWDVKLCGY